MIRIRIIVCYLMVVMATLSAGAATFTIVPDIFVLDEHDAAPGDGVAMTDRGTTTLRAAVEEANALPGPDTIIVQHSLFTPPGESGVYLTLGNLYIEDDLSILGRAANESFNDLNGILWESNESTIVVREGISLHMEEMVLDFQFRDAPSVAFILEEGSSLTAKPFRERNSAYGLFIRNGNRAIESLGGDVNLDKSVLGTNEDIVSISTVSISNASLELSRTFVTGHNPGQPGGGILMSNGDLVVNTCWFSGSHASAGGGIHATRSTLEVVNSTFAEQETEGPGGAIYLEDSDLLILNATLSDNIANIAKGIETLPGGGGGIFADTDSLVEIGNTIIAENVDGNGLAPDVEGHFTSLGHNLIGVVDGATGIGQETDMTGSLASPLDPMLGPYDSFYSCFPLLLESPAIDMGNSELLKPGVFLGTTPLKDVRGGRYPMEFEFFRFQGASVDIGSFELDTTPDTHTADQNRDLIISLTEMLRVIQFFNSDGYSCAESFDATEDGYIPGQEGTLFCAPSDLEFDIFDWDVNLTELLRVIQLYNSDGYTYCPFDDTEDDFCPGTE